MIIKGFSLWQPWAILWAIGEKELETRGKATKYRGWLAIHAAKRRTIDQALYFLREPYRSVLAGHGYMNFDALPFGCVLAVGYLTKVYRTEEIRPKLSEQELSFGDFSDGRAAWKLEHKILLPEPIPVTGARGLWDWEVPVRLQPYLEQADVGGN